MVVRGDSTDSYKTPCSFFYYYLTDLGLNRLDLWCLGDPAFRGRHSDQSNSVPDSWSAAFEIDALWILSPLMSEWPLWSSFSCLHALSFPQSLALIVDLGSLVKTGSHIECLLPGAEGQLCCLLEASEPPSVLEHPVFFFFPSQWSWCSKCLQ